MGLSGDNYLLEQRNQYICSSTLSNGLIQWIECDNINKSMKVKTRSENVVEWNALNLNDLIKDDIIDLSENGERWEGDSLDHLPYGYGRIFNSENQIVYEGFVFNGMKVCFGKEYYEDVGIIEYIGHFYNNKRNGNGIFSILKFRRYSSLFIYNRIVKTLNNNIII